MIEMSSVFKKKHKKIPPAFLHEGIFVTPRPYLNGIAASAGFSYAYIGLYSIIFYRLFLIFTKMYLLRYFDF